MKNRSIDGIAYLIDGFKLIFKPGIKRFVIIPFIINLLLFVGLFLVSKHYFSAFDTWITSHLPHWLQWLGTLLWVIFFISFLLVMIFTFVTIANIISAPFNGLLSEKVEFYLTGTVVPDRSFSSLVKDIPRMIGRQFAIIGYFLPRAIALFILFFIPVVQMIVPPLWFLLTAWFMTLQYIDYPTDNHQIPLNNVLEWLRERRGISISFGIMTLIASMIPIVNFFVVPAAVAGATKLYIEEKS